MPAYYGMRSVPRLAFRASVQVSFTRAVTQDTAFFKDVTENANCPEYGGYNMRRARESGQELTKKTKLIYTPFLDMPPAEGNTMKPAMVQAQHITSLTGQKYTIFTCDQQLYQVVVNIVWFDHDLSLISFQDLAECIC